MARLSERGSVVSFIVVGAVLAALLMGGVYFVKHQLAGKLQDDNTIQLADNAKEAVEDTANKASDAAKDATESDKSSEEPAKEEPVASEPSVDKESTEPSKDSTDDQATSSDSSRTTSEEKTSEPKKDEQETMPATGVSVEELPQTGPGDDILSLGMIGTLAALVAIYRRSLQAKI